MLGVGPHLRGNECIFLGARAAVVEVDDARCVVILRHARRALDWLLGARASHTTPARTCRCPRPPTRRNCRTHAHPIDVVDAVAMVMTRCPSEGLSLAFGVRVVHSNNI